MAIPAGCPRDRFFLCQGAGGVSNIQMRLYTAIAVAQESNRTLLLPVLPERPFKHELGPGRLMSLAEVFDVQRFCRAVRTHGGCIVCVHFPLRYLGVAVPELRRLARQARRSNRAAFDVLTAYAAREFSLPALAQAGFCPEAKLKPCAASSAPLLLTGSPLSRAKEDQRLADRTLGGGRTPGGGTARRQQVLNHKYAWGEDQVDFLKSAFAPPPALQGYLTQVRRKLRGQPFVALHTRVEADWEEYTRHHGEELNATGLIAVLRRSLPELQLSHMPLYVACGDAALVLPELRRSFPHTAIVTRTDVVEAGALPYLVEAALDKFACDMADVVISDYKSSFGQTLWLQRAQVYAAHHPEEPTAGRSYSYGTTAIRLAGDRRFYDAFAKDDVCFREKLLRIGYRLRVDPTDGERVYHMVRQGCAQEESKFVRSLFAAATWLAQAQPGVLTIAEGHSAHQQHPPL